MTSRSLFQLRPGPRGLRGVTLVELMVAMAISLLLILVVSYAYLGSKRSFKVQDALSQMQENARLAFETMAFDIRMAGFIGCSAATSVNTLNASGEWDRNLFGAPLVGYEGGVSTFPDGVAGNVLRGDALTILRTGQPEYIVASHNPSSAQLQLTANHDIKQGEILVVTDCSHAAVFQMTNVNNNNTVDVVVHNTGGATVPGNCTKGLGSPLDCASANGTAYTFAPGSRVMRLSSANYHVRQKANGEPALYRLRLAHDGSGNAARVAEELQGVEDFQVLYGVDTTGTPDGAVDSYMTASAVEGAGVPGGSAAEKWQRVLSVRISLLMVSPGSDAITNAPQAYAFNGTTVTPTDRRLRKVFSTTIAVRNRL